MVAHPRSNQTRARAAFASYQAAAAEAATIKSALATLNLTAAPFSLTQAQATALVAAIDARITALLADQQNRMLDAMIGALSSYAAGRP